MVSASKQTETPDPTKATDGFDSNHFDKQKERTQTAHNFFHIHNDENEIANRG